MTSGRKDSFRLFRIAGIDIYVHWLWILVAYFQITTRQRAYSAIVWNIAEYLILFLIVLLHEFGHALACRQVGGKADQIMLWPLGGVAFVAPPRRPGATLWSIAAGPLVNVVLAIPLFALFWVSSRQDWDLTSPDTYLLIRDVFTINLGLLIFNLLPIYPLDGGQILRSTLWFFIGESRSLFVASAVGFLGVAGLGFYAFKAQSVWIGILTLWMGQRCLQGWKLAKAIAMVRSLPRRPGFSCPVCHQAPPLGAVWRCEKCRTLLDVFETGTDCPACGEKCLDVPCSHCRTKSLLKDWREPAAGVTTVTTDPVPPELPERA